jgi:hypothetical protein
MADVYTEETTPEGARRWLKNGLPHRDGDEPASIYPNGTRFWFKDGQLHRDGDEPASIYANGTRCWYKNGQPHRDGDEPAVIWADGTRFWFKDGQTPEQGDTDFTAIAKDASYTLYRVKDKTGATLYIAGCRRFTLAQAREHWCTENPYRPSFAEALLKESTT